MTTFLAMAPSSRPTDEWISREGGHHDGRYAQIPFPTADVEQVTFCGVLHLRVRNIPVRLRKFNQGQPVLMVPAELCA
jgi:hypothetical protein